MFKPRVAETDQGITGEFTTEIYDQMMRRMRDKGWLETREIIGAGISSGWLSRGGNQFRQNYKEGAF